MNKQELITHLKARVSYCEEEKARYWEMHKDQCRETGDTHTIWSEMVDWHKGRACAFNVAIELIEDELQ